jgi:phenylalanyl-tRNA synthetase beta chain
MTNVKFSRKDFEKQVKLTKEVIEKIPMFGTPLESLTDEEVEVEIFPNRPDLLSLQGYLRSFKAFLSSNTGLKDYPVSKPKEDFRVKVSSSVKDVRPFTACAIVTNLSFDDDKIKQIIDLQEKLHSTVGRNRKKVAIGVYPLEKIKLPILYEAREPEKIKFIPLEYDREINAIQILNKHPTGREYAHLLKNLDKFPVFVDSDNKILSMPPIINSHETGKVTHETNSVFIECSGSHFATLSKTLNIIVTTLADMGGKIHQMTLKYSDKEITTPDLKPEKIKFSLDNVNKLLGLNLKEKEIEKLLARMGLEYNGRSVSVPAWRTDVLHEVDLIEDIAIAYGYENFTPEIPNVATAGEENSKEKLKTKLREALIGLGFLEVSSYHLIKKSEAEISELKDEIELEDSKTEYKLLRPNLLIPALRIISENKDHEYPQEIFEIGTVFSLDKEGETETGINESENLVVACAPANFTKVKQVLSYIASTFSFNFELKESNINSLIEGRAAKILSKGKEIGYLGEVHPETLRSWSIKMPLAVLEFCLDNLM